MGTNIDNAIINGVLQVTTTEELREWLLSRNLPGVITQDGFQQNVQMLEEASKNFEEDNDAFLQELIVGNEFYQSGGYYSDGVLFSAMSGPMYSLDNLGSGNIDTATDSSGNLMPHIQCELPDYIFPVMSSSLCELNLFGTDAEYSENDGSYYDATTSDGTPVSDTYNPGRFGILPPFNTVQAENIFSYITQYGDLSSDLVAITQEQNPATNNLSWFNTNPVIYDLFISAGFGETLGSRWDVSSTYLSPLDNHFYGLKIDQRGFEYNNASAPDGSGIKTFYTPLQPYNDGYAESPSTLIQNTRILEQWILGSYGTRIVRDSHLLRNSFTSSNMYLSNVPGQGGVDYIEGTVGLNNDYLSLAWVLSGPRKPKSNTNYFVEQLSSTQMDPTALAGGLGEHVIDQDFGWDRTTVPDFSSNVAKTKESDAIWEPGVNIPGFEVSDHVGNKGILSYTQRILNTAMGNDSQGVVRPGDFIRQDTPFVKSKYGPVSRGSGIESINFADQGQRPFYRSWVRAKRNQALTSERPKNYSRYDALIRHQELIMGGTRTSPSGGSSIIDDTGTAHIAPTDETDNKRFMFSLENLAWKDHNNDLSPHEIGPNGGRVMWFPPYIESWTENSSANWTQTDIIGRIEPIFTYKNSFRQTNLNFMLVTDYPEVLDTIAKDFSPSNSDMEAAQFFGGEDFDRYKEAITTGKPLGGNQNFFDEVNGVAWSGATNFLQPLDDSTFSGTTETLEVYYYSGCTTFGFQTPPFPEWPYTGDENSFGPCSNCNTLFEGQYLNTEEEDKFMTRGGESKLGIKDKLQALVDWLISEQGKRYQIEITYYTGPIKSSGDDFGTPQYEADGYPPDPMGPFPEDIPVIANAEEQSQIPFEIPTIFVENPLSTEATTLITNEGNICGKLRGHKVQELIQGLLIERETYYREGQVAFNGMDPTWYMEDAAPADRWSIVHGGECPYESIIVEPTFTGSTQYDEDEKSFKHIHALPVEIKVKPSQNLFSQNAQLEAEQAYVTALQTVVEEYESGGNSRIPTGTFFESLEKKDMFAYQNYKERINNFHPAFHSTHPCAFNERLTFLNQTLRPGPSIEGIVGPNNMAFGRPPICVLRLGDFYNCKVVINNIDFSYEQPFWDLNPEGIGAQPWVCRVSMQMYIVGGMSLGGPLSQLQNAVSFNYFANTEICEPDRANPTVPTIETTTAQESTIPPQTGTTTTTTTTTQVIPNNSAEGGPGTGNNDGLNGTGISGFAGDVSDQNTTIWTGWVSSGILWDAYKRTFDGCTPNYYTPQGICIKQQLSDYNDYTFSTQAKLSKLANTTNMYEISYGFKSVTTPLLVWWQEEDANGELLFDENGLAITGAGPLTIGNIFDGNSGVLPLQMEPFEDTAGCVENAENASCEVLNQQMIILGEKIEEYYQNWFMQYGVYMIPEKEGLPPGPGDPYLVLDIEFCFSRTTGRIDTNSTWSACLTDPFGQKLETETGNKLEIEEYMLGP